MRVLALFICHSESAKHPKCSAIGVMDHFLFALPVIRIFLSHFFLVCRYCFCWCYICFLGEGGMEGGLDAFISPFGIFSQTQSLYFQMHYFLLLFVLFSYFASYCCFVFLDNSKSALELIQTHSRWCFLTLLSCFFLPLNGEMNESLSTWECNHWCPAFLNFHHPSAVSKETETAEPLTVCEFQRPSAAEDLMQPWQRQQPPQRLADQEDPHMLLNLARKKEKYKHLK